MSLGTLGVVPFIWGRLVVIGFFPGPWVHSGFHG